MLADDWVWLHADSVGQDLSLQSRLSMVKAYQTWPELEGWQVDVCRGLRGFLHDPAVVLALPPAWLASKITWIDDDRIDQIILESVLWLTIVRAHTSLYKKAVLWLGAQGSKVTALLVREGCWCCRFQRQIKPDAVNESLSQLLSVAKLRQPKGWDEIVLSGAWPQAWEMVVDRLLGDSCQARLWQINAKDCLVILGRIVQGRRHHVVRMVLEKLRLIKGE